MAEYIVVRNAREHNLKGVTVALPRNRFVVITGLSGSGKSSLAFDTIFAEGQRRYVESLSTYARQFLEQMEKPDVESIEGLSPAISIEQRSASRNPRSTVGTTTEIYDYLRVLYARIGQPHCHRCGLAISSQTVQQMAERLQTLPEQTKIAILAPIVRGRKGEYQREFDQLRKDGFVRVKVDGQVIDLAEDIVINKNQQHNIDVFIDRLIIKDGIRNRLIDSLETTLKIGKGLVKVEHQQPGAPDGELLFSERFACVDCGVSYPEISPRMFSFNNPHGACEDCGGLGTKMYFDPVLIVPVPELSLLGGAVKPYAKSSSLYFLQSLHALAKEYDFSLLTPFSKLQEEIRQVILYGSGERELTFQFKKDSMTHTVRRSFEGVVNNLERRYRETESDFIRQELEAYMSVQTCPRCEGRRLRQESLHVRLGDLDISRLTDLSVETLLVFLADLRLDGRQRQIAAPLLKEVEARLFFLRDVGLGYLTLSRSAASLSGGEAQRIRLATQIGSQLVGVLYILDEPSIGLHQRDNAKLIATLHRLRDLGNTVIVVEHDRETIEAADFLVDMGPGAGVAGGEVVYAGPLEGIQQCEASLTGAYLSGRRAIEVPTKRRPIGERTVKILGARGHNLQDLDVSLPLGVLTCVTGVSGSGKSSLVNETLARHFQRTLYKAKTEPLPFRAILGDREIDKIIVIDQSPIGRTPRSNPATYTGVFNDIRELFTQLPESKIRGYKPGRYSFNVKGGRCEACSGDGQIKIEMHFLPDMYVTCELCDGKRYNRETLEINFKGKNIAEVLAMTVAEASTFLGAIPKIKSKLDTLMEVGLSYLQLGQSATTLSGGEAQRIKLSRELTKRATGKTLYILDEPTTGLHFEDVRHLLAVLHRLTDNGNTIVVIEHNLDVIKNADHIIDLGPEGGTGGGKLLACGTPEEVATVEGSYTGQYLRRVLH
ncbi:MAG: excinuclease ABC subunit A [Deltaproteobacteria bacterium RIFOXYA12_FULL_61_11]|nr:MAG: excinuclease ABC subunit A [Deltaproteobacteria bacterium RIFOXYA12_FULL_61_11]